jgi:hypothetical protein
MDIDHELKTVLQELLDACREFQIRPQLIGGLAVRGYTSRKRYTHDIDLVIGKRDKANLVTILKRMGFDYRNETAFGGVKATKRVGDVTVEIHISVGRLWDMRSGQEYVLSSRVHEVPVDDRGSLMAPAASIEDLLILKLLPLRDRDIADAIVLILDNPELDATAFWQNCDRTGNTVHVRQRLNELEQELKSGAFRDTWQSDYGEPLSIPEVRIVLERVQRLKRTKP